MGALTQRSKAERLHLEVNVIGGRRRIRGRPSSQGRRSSLSVAWAQAVVGGLAVDAAGGRYGLVGSGWWARCLATLVCLFGFCGGNRKASVLVCMWKWNFHVGPVVGPAARLIHIIKKKKANIRHISKQP